MKETAPIIRPYNSGDLDSLVSLETASHPSAWTRAELIACIQRPDSDCRVIEEFGRVVGFFVVQYEPDGLHVVNLAIGPVDRRRGLALRSLERIDEIAAERFADRIVLEVRESNLPAQLLYRKAGYLAVEIVTGYYKEEDAFRMVKRCSH